MSLVPAGKTRIMVAQQFANPLSDGFGAEHNPRSFDDTKPALDPTESDPMGAPMGEQSDLEPTSPLDTEGAMDEDLGEDPVNDDVSLGAEEEEAQLAPKENRKTLTSYIFEKLQSYGYPGRRLQEFKSEFVKESVSPEGQKDIEVVIPDKKYPDERGFTDTIENEELKSIAHEVNTSFGLNFNGADRAGGKWTIKFTSADIADPEADAISHDSLDQVYGKPDKSNQPGQPGQKSIGGMGGAKPAVAAYTHSEMIKAGKNKIIKKIQKMTGE
jgi:hypothetical protein